MNSRAPIPRTPRARRAAAARVHPPARIRGCRFTANAGRMPLHICDASRLTTTACCSPSSTSQGDKPDGAHVLVPPDPVRDVMRAAPLLGQSVADAWTPRLALRAARFTQAGQPLDLAVLRFAHD